MLLLILAVIFALLNGWLVTRPTRRGVWVTKPAVMILLIAWVLSTLFLPGVPEHAGNFPPGVVPAGSGVFAGRRYFPDAGHKIPALRSGRFLPDLPDLYPGIRPDPSRAGGVASGHRAGSFSAHCLCFFDFPDIPRTGRPLATQSKSPCRTVPAAGLADAVFGPAELV